MTDPVTDAGGSDRGLLLGEGLFETVLVRDGAPQQLDAHLARMRASAVALGLPAPGDLERRVGRALGAALARGAPPRRAALRITLSVSGPRGLDPPGRREPRVHVAVSPLPDAPPSAPLRLVTASAHRLDPSAAISGHKTLSWLPFVLARREAAARGADAALVRTVDGDVGEADHANVFAVAGGVVVTPSLDRGVLAGITRARALDALAAAGRAVEERALAPEDVAAATEVWLTSSLDGVRAVGSIDARALPAPGPVTAWLADCLSGS